jgi:hypothetical protein
MILNLNKLVNIVFFVKCGWDGLSRQKIFISGNKTGAYEKMVERFNKWPFDPMNGIRGIPDGF